MTTLLVNPPFFRFLGLEQDYVPLSLLAVGAQIGDSALIKNMEIGPGLTYQGYAERAAGFERYLAGITDTHNAVWNELRQTIEEFNVRYIGVTVLNVKFRSFQTVYKIAKEYGVQVFAGGPHTLIEPEAYPHDVALFPGEYEAGPSGARVRDLDTLPLPQYASLLDNYSPNAYAHIMTSRGCPFRCRFCSSALLWNRKVTYKSADRILAEMRQVASMYGADQFTIWDEVFTLHKARLREFCSKYDLAAKWRCDTRADIIDDDTVRMMRDAGCSQMSLGVESGVDSILRYVGKGETIADYRRAAEILDRNGVQWKAYCIIGFPEETAEDMRQTIAFVKSLRPFRITLSYFTPYKGTPLFGECIERGLIGADAAMNDFFHQGAGYFCPNLTEQEYAEVRRSLSCEVDEYNKEALLTWH